MIDKFKIRGVVSKLSLDNLVHLKEIHTDKGLKNVYRIPGKRKDVCLFLTLMEGSNIYTINGNLRKWWYGKSNVYNDLSYRSYFQCLKYLAEVIDVDLFELLQFKIRHIELGINVRLNRKYARIIPSMISYPKRNRLNYYDETIMFEGRKFDIKIYDKLKESAFKNIRRKKIADRLVEKKFCMRFELDIRAKSGLRIKDRIESLNTIKDNWNVVVDYLLETYLQIEVVDEFANFKQIENNSMSLMPLKELFVYKAMDNMGIEKTDKMINKYAGRKKSEYRKEFRRILREYQNSEKLPLKRVVEKYVKNSLEKLKRN